MKANPDARLVRIKTDLLGYVNISNEIETDDTTWGKVKQVWDPPKPGTIHDPASYVRKTVYKHKPKNWNIHKRIVLDEGDMQSILKKGGLIFGMAGTGKSTTLNKIKDALATGSTEQSTETTVLRTCAFTHKASKIVDGNTLHLLFGIDMKTRKIDYNKIKSYVKEGVKYIFVDEISMIPSWLWNVIAHVKEQYGFIFTGCGDWKQLKPVDEENIDFENSWIVKYVFNNTSYELTKVWRFNDSRLLRDAHAASNGESINFSDYKKEEYPLALCHTNDAVDAINKKWNDYYAAQHTQIKEVTGHDKIKFKLYAGLKVMAYKSDNNYAFTNSQELVVTSFTETEFVVKDSKGVEMRLENKHLAKFKPAFAMTVHKAQGSTFNCSISIYEYKSMKHDMLYVALTRATDFNNVNFCEIEQYNPYSGCVYSYDYGGRFYIGSTTNLEKRRREHAQNIRHGFKFTQAINQYGGLHNFKHKVLKTLKFSNIRDLRRLEDQLIIKYDSVNNGFNMRYNEAQEVQ